MKTANIILGCAFIISIVACDNKGLINPLEPENTIEMRGQQNKVTGDVEIVWNGMNNNPVHQRTAEVSFEAFARSYDKAPKGSFRFEIFKDNVPDRQIEARVYAAAVNSGAGKVWVLAEVIMDSKACTDHGGMNGGHDEGEECDHEDGDTGCDHDDGSEGHDAGCEGDDEDHDGEMHIAGSRCRIGQIIAVKIHDQATPGTEGDGITWRWFNSNNPNVPDIDQSESWQHLCKKNILSGNLVVH